MHMRRGGSVKNLTWKEAERIAREKLGVGDEYIMYGYEVIEPKGIVVVMLDKKNNGKWSYEDIKCKIHLNEINKFYKEDNE